MFHSTKGQNARDGTFVFLRADLWEPDYAVISLEGYEGYDKGRLNIIVATSRQEGRKYLLASAHGNSTHAEDGRLQIALIKWVFDEFTAVAGLRRGSVDHRH